MLENSWREMLETTIQSTRISYARRCSVGTTLYDSIVRLLFAYNGTISGNVESGLATHYPWGTGFLAFEARRWLPPSMNGAMVLGSLLPIAPENFVWI